MLTVLRVGSLWQRLRSSLQLVPISFVLGAIVLGLLLPWLDVALSDTRAWYLYAGEADSARELLSTIASSMLSLAGLVFSITILVLQLASSQFSPRVLRTFMSDRTVQVAMGMFLGSFVYAMVLLPQVRGGDDGAEFVPALSVIVAFALALLSVVMFVRYIHHMAHAIRAVQVIATVAAETHKALATLYPDIGLDDPNNVQLPTRAANQRIKTGTHAGVVTALNEDALMRLACKHDALIAFSPSMGEFVPRDAPLFQVWGEQVVSEEELHECVVLENERTPHQDVAFGLRQLVDIAERALSPGINDPSTAVQALDYVHDLLRVLAVRKLPVPARFDKEQHFRLYLPCPDWPSYVHLGLDEIRQYGGSSIQVMRRLRLLLQDLLTLAPPPRAPVLIEQLHLLDQQIARSFPNKAEQSIASLPNGRREKPYGGSTGASP